MREGGFVLGGEQSGHVILSDHATTGDGVLTALHLLARIAETGRPLADLAGGRAASCRRCCSTCAASTAPGVGDRARRWPRPWPRPRPSSATRAACCCVRRAPSRVVRVMVEAATHEQATEVAERLAEVVRATLG